MCECVCVCVSVCVSVCVVSIEYASTAKRQGYNMPQRS